MRSSTRSDWRSCTRPPNIVSSVEELIRHYCGGEHYIFNKKYVLRASKYFMEQVKREFRILRSGFSASNGRDAGEISFRKKSISVLVFASSGREELFDIREVRGPLIRLEMHVFSCATPIIMPNYTRRGMTDVLVSEASCSIPLCKSNSAKSNVSLLYFFFNMFAAKLGTKKQNVGAKLHVARITRLSSLKEIFRPSCGRIPGMLGIESKCIFDWVVLVTHHGLPLHSELDKNTCYLPLSVLHTPAMPHQRQDVPLEQHVLLFCSVLLG
jgi:hypothetical protein